MLRTLWGRIVPAFRGYLRLALLLVSVVVLPNRVWPANATVDDAPASGPDYSGFTKYYKLPYGNTRPLDFDHLSSMSVRVSINGGPPLRLQIDTGSTGVVVGAMDVPNIDPNAPAGSITYTSSGIELDGVWTPATVAFLDAKDRDGNIATASVPVLAVKQRKIHPGAVNARNATPSDQPRAFMLGIGFGRGKEPKQECNPWVCLREMQSGEMRRGYVLTRDGITLGLTSEAVGPGFVFQKLQPRVPIAGATVNAVKDWESSRGWVVIDGKRQPTAAMLLDTGLGNMMIGGSGVTANMDVAGGTPVEVFLLSGKLRYSFKVGDANNPFAPSRVTFTPRPQPSVNTGRRALAGFDYLYDADGGYFGLRERGSKGARE